jgi:hypothetical protein
MVISDAYGRRILQLVPWALRRFKTHPQWDDLVSFALLRVCEAVVKLPEDQDPEAALGMVVHAASWGANQFLRSNHCDLAFRHYTEKGHALPRPVAFEAVSDEEWQWLGHEPDFAPALIEALWMEHVALVVRQCMTEQEQEILWRWLGGQSQEQIARAMGRSQSWVGSVCERAITRARIPYGLPPVGIEAWKDARNARRRQQVAAESPEERAERCARRRKKQRERKISAGKALVSAKTSPNSS